MSNAFDHIPPTAHGHFLLNYYAAVYRLICYMQRLSKIGGQSQNQTFKKYPFIAKYFAEMRRHMPATLSWNRAWTWWAAEITAWETALDNQLPLRALTTAAGVNFQSRIGLMIAGLVEEDSRFGTLLASLQEPLPYRQPSLELIGQIMADKGRSEGTDPWQVCRPLLQAGLVEAANADAPRSEWILRAPPLLWDVIRGQITPQPAAWGRYHAPETFPKINDLILPDAFLSQLAQVPAMVTAGKVQALVLRGMQGSERLAVLGAAAGELGHGLLDIQPRSDQSGEAAKLPEREWARVGPLCTMADCWPVVTYDLGPGETVELPSLTGYKGPVGVMMGFEGGLKGALAEKALTLTLPPPKVAQRLQYWQQTLAGYPIEDLATISERFHLPGGYIRQAGTMAIAQAALNKRETITIADVRHACRALNRQMLDTLAVRIEADGKWDHLVVSEATAVKLYELERRCRQRERLLDHLGPAFGSATNRGVRTLFSGSSGTGKTLAARILAAELGMDLYRVDLASVVNKYIGETEKNLHRVLSRAEELDVILLLDEGDALLGNRTEVKSSNDRYANLETNYLLQRLESYQGIILVTTNAGQNIDSAFQRRMDVVVDFVPPQVQERWAIWQLHLPLDHQVEPLYLEQIARQCVLTGGQIRNAALHATLLAVDDGGGQVNRWHLEAAVQSEYRKAGAICPLNRDDRRGETDGKIESFLQILV